MSEQMPGDEEAARAFRESVESLAAGQPNVQDWPARVRRHVARRRTQRAATSIVAVAVALAGVAGAGALLSGGPDALVADTPPGDASASPAPSASAARPAASAASQPAASPTGGATVAARLPSASPTRASSPPRPAPAPAPSASGSGEEAGTTTGIDARNKVVRIAVHGNGDAARSGAERYWRNGPGGKPRTLTNGYTVEPVFFDGGGRLSTDAHQCNEQAAASFLIYGSAGTEQIKACARSEVLRRGNVPYLSTGATESGLGALPHYFATSPTFKQQAPLLIRAARDGGFLSGKWAIVTTEGENYADASEAMSAALQASSATFDADADVYTVPTAPRDCGSLGSTIRSRGYSTIYFMTSQPSFFAQCVKVIGTEPTYTGPGATFGYNNIANLACSAASPGSLKAVYMHPVTGLEKAGERTGGQAFASDVEYQVYGAMQTLESALNLVRGPLTREKLIRELRTGRLPDGIAPGAAFAGGSFGGKAVYALRARCGGTPDTNTFVTHKRYDR